MRLSVIEVIEQALRDNGIKKKYIGVVSNSIVDALEAMHYEIIISKGDKMYCETCGTELVKVKKTLCGYVAATGNAIYKHTFVCPKREKMHWLKDWWKRSSHVIDHRGGSWDFTYEEITHECI